MTASSVTIRVDSETKKEVLIAGALRASPSPGLTAQRSPAARHAALSSPAARWVGLLLAAVRWAA